MIFINPDRKVIDNEVLNRCEDICGIRLPKSVRALYLASNGGMPEPNILQTDNGEAYITNFYPIDSGSEWTAVGRYKLLVREREIVPPHFFPFAGDCSGGMYFVDTHTDDGQVFLYQSDTIYVQPTALGLSFNEFWASLRPEQI